MKEFNSKKTILIAVLAAVVVSFFVSVLVVGFYSGEKPNDVLKQVIERAPAQPPFSQKEVAGRISRQDELVVLVVKRVAPAVVSVVATKDVPVIEQYFVNPFQGDPFFEQFFGQGFGQQFGIPEYRQKGTEKQQVSAGSGFIISPDGLVLTNKHVVSDTAADYTVFLNDGTKLAAKVLARDPVQDLAVLKVEKTGLSAVDLGDSSQIAIGQTAIAIGNALGEFRNTVSVGVVSGLGRTVNASGPGVGREELQELIQTDAAINPGNSGGPLLNLYGEVIGINTALAQGAQSIGFAIPINKAKRDISSVESVGRIVYPFLGVRYLLITPDLKVERKLPVDYGALVEGDQNNPAVASNSPADKAGIKSGDIILEFDSVKVTASNTLAALIQKHQVGDTVTLKVLRGSQTLNLSVTLEERK